jgi:hypothetical protein
VTWDGPGNMADASNYVSLSTYVTIWHHHYPHLKVSRPTEDICEMCYRFANRHRHPAVHNRDTSMATNSTDDGNLFQLRHCCRPSLSYPSSLSSSSSSSSLFSLIAVIAPAAANAAVAFSASAVASVATAAADAAAVAAAAVAIAVAIAVAAATTIAATAAVVDCYVFVTPPAQF